MLPIFEIPEPIEIEILLALTPVAALDRIAQSIEKEDSLTVK
jgi:hypothetical protein